MVNYKTEQQRLKMQMLDQEAMIQRQRLAIMELADKRTANLANIEASERAIADLLCRLEGESQALEKQRLKMQITSLQATIERQLLENMELVERKQKVLESWEGCKKALEHFQANLTGLEEAHGKLIELDFQGAFESIR